MIKLILFLISSTPFSAAAQGNNVVELSGIVKNFDNQVIVQDNSEFFDLLQTKPDHLFIPDSTGHFSIKFELKIPNYFSIGPNVLYLSPGDKLSVYIDYNDPGKAAFKGTSAEQNEYLKSIPNPKAGSFLYAGDNIQSSIQKTIDFILAQAEKRQKALMSHGNLSREFTLLETARTKADIILSLLYMEGYYPYEHKFLTNKDSMAAFSIDYHKIVLPCIKKYASDFLNPDLLKLQAYRTIAHFLIRQQNESADTAVTHKIKDWLEAKALVKDMRRTNDKKVLKAMLPKIDSITTEEYHVAVKETWGQLTRFGPGDKAIDIQAYNTSGKRVDLSCFTGKIIYIDLWATWCGPCLQELKPLETIKEKYKDRKDIVFISLSIDNDKQAWLKKINDRQMSGIQLRINSQDMRSYSVTGVPRTILIDKQFRIVDMYGPLPSDKSIDDRLANLSAIKN